MSPEHAVPASALFLGFTGDISGGFGFCGFFRSTWQSLGYEGDPKGFSITQNRCN
jgi:hypothetical protein